MRFCPKTGMACLGTNWTGTATSGTNLGFSKTRWQYIFATDYKHTRFIPFSANLVQSGLKTYYTKTHRKYIWIISIETKWLSIVVLSITHNILKIRVLLVLIFYLSILHAIACSENYVNLKRRLY